MTFPLTPMLGLSPADSDAAPAPRFRSISPTWNAGRSCRGIDATTAQGPRSPVPRANKPLSARTLQPRLNVKPQQAFATIPIVPTSCGFVQSGFYEVAPTTRAPCPFSHATSQNPQDSKARAPRFDCFKFQFHSICSVTFATVSANSRRRATSPPCRCHHPTRVRPQARQPPWPEHNDKLTWCEICGRPHGRNPRPHRSDLRSGANADKVLGVYFSRPGHCALRPIPPPHQIQAGSWLVRELPIKRRRNEVCV